MDTRSATGSPHESYWRRKLPRIAGSIAIIGAITALDHILPHLNHTTITLTFLMGVLGIAAGWGLLEAVVASAATIACEAYFFLAPIYDFRIEDSQNWVAVAAFFVVSVVASSLSTSARNKAAEAIERQRELELLYELSQSLIGASPPRNRNNSSSIRHGRPSASNAACFASPHRTGSIAAGTPTSKSRRRTSSPSKRAAICMGKSAGSDPRCRRKPRNPSRTWPPSHSIAHVRSRPPREPKPRVRARN